MFIKQFIQTYKKVRLEYKNYLQEQREKKALLSAKSDFSLLEKLIQAVNKSPDLRVEVRLEDGTVLLLKTYKAPERKTASQLIMVPQEFGKYSTTQMARLVERRLFNKSRRKQNYGSVKRTSK